MIDITDQRTIPYKFAQQTTSKADKRKTIQLLQEVHRYSIQVRSLGAAPNSVSFLNEKERDSRIIFYDFQRLLTAENLFVVVFYANMRRNLSRKFNKKYIATDWEIAMSLTPGDNILCYASQEQEDGNWFNLVLFTEEQAKHTVMGSHSHHHAVTDLASKRFSWIRLHNAYLPKGLRQCREIALTKSKYYGFDENWFAFRMYK